MKKNIGLIIGVTIIFVGLILFLVSGPSTIDESQELWHANWVTTDSARDGVFGNPNLNNINQQTFYANVLTAERLEIINENLQQLNDNLQILHQSSSNTNGDLRSTFFSLTLILAGTIVATSSVFNQKPPTALEKDDVEAG